MIQKDEFLNTTRRPVHLQWWMPDMTGDTALLMLHGIGEHSGCYEKWATLFVQQGFSVAMPDWWGHGRSWGRRGHARLTALQGELLTVSAQVRRQTACRRLFIYAHSMGAAIALRAILNGTLQADGAIIASPWLEMVRPPARPLIGVAVVAALLIPQLTVPTGIRAEQLSQHGREKSSRSDPLIHKRISVGLFVDLWQNYRRLMHTVTRPAIPLLLMGGENDRLIQPSSFQQLAGQLEVECKLWQGMGHDLHNEIDNREVFHYAMQWLNSIQQ